MNQNMISGFVGFERIDTYASYWLATNWSSLRSLPETQLQQELRRVASVIPEFIETINQVAFQIQNEVQSQNQTQTVTRRPGYQAA